MMQPTNAQDFEEGDIVALSFADPDQEAAYIAQNLQALRGISIKEPGKDNPDHARGISWSDMAILLRSVRANGEPITRALDAVGIPYVVAGMNNLFGTPEAEAARQLFYFMASRPSVDAAGLQGIWATAGLGLDAAAVGQAVKKAQVLRIEFNAANLRNVRYGMVVTAVRFPRIFSSGKCLQRQNRAGTFRKNNRGDDGIIAALGPTTEGFSLSNE
jgi:DNA helicase II / ATP-dependent DNA helicase PcrA